MGSSHGCCHGWYCDGHGDQSNLACQDTVAAGQIDCRARWNEAGVSKRAGLRGEDCSCGRHSWPVSGAECELSGRDGEHVAVGSVRADETAVEGTTGAEREAASGAWHRRVRTGQNYGSHRHDFCCWAGETHGDNHNVSS